MEALNTYLNLIESLIAVVIAIRKLTNWRKEQKKKDNPI